MLNEILEIPGNRPVFADLQRLLSEKKAIAFVGAGASAELYPLWGELIRLLCDHAVTSGFASESDRQFWLSMATTKPAQVVQGIRSKLTSPQLSGLLRQIFGPKTGAPRYTPTHAALMRVPFSGYLTTNYDPGLTEARLSLRPSAIAVGFSTWRDHEEFEAWRNAERLSDPSWCPILFAHGFYQRSSTIVLDIEEYRRAYQDRRWQELFKYLWASTNLVFVGFGFSDPFLDFITGEIVEKTSNQGQHIAFIGVGATEPYSEERRRFFLRNYNARAIFYPVAGNDHSALLTLLDSLAQQEPHPVPAVSLPPPGSSAAIPVRWVHEPTDDNKFTGRKSEQERLDRWVSDPAVRAIGICAIGGAGKTALVGHWLKHTAGWRRRPFTGLFAWSFYQERDSLTFLHSLLEWAEKTLGFVRPNESIGPVAMALFLLQKQPLVVVLDGLEVLQEGVEQTRHGAFLDGPLRSFLGNLCDKHHESLAILTSRFVFADLERYLGTPFLQLELPGLSPESGAALLGELETGGSEADRKEVSDRLEGHPLGLRVFADAIPVARRSEPLAFLEEAFHTDELPLDSPLTRKVRGLLKFYQDRLPLAQAQLLGVVSLFRSPVPEEMLLRLAQGIFSVEDAELAGGLETLHRRKILTREPAGKGYGYSCHPILRDHFRSSLLGTGVRTARKAADLLKAQPAKERPRTVREVEPVLLAIDLLLESDDFGAADQLFRDRLVNGEVFKWIPAPSEGLLCALGFVRDELRQQQCERKLSPDRRCFYLNSAGFFASLSGFYEQAAGFYTQANAISRSQKNAMALGIGLQNEADLAVYLGRLSEAAERATEALDIARSLDDEKEVAACLARRGLARTLAGQLRPAARDFAVANALESEISGGHGLHSIRGIEWAELLLRSGYPSLAASLTSVNLLLCRQNRWNEDVGRCHWMLGVCALAEGKLEQAEAELRRAETILQGGQMLFHLTRLQVAFGFLALLRRDVPTALLCASEVLALSQSHGMRLVQADALILRGWARLLLSTTASTESARLENLACAWDDAEDALSVSEQCGYVWGQSDALRLLADTRAALARAQGKRGEDASATQHRDAVERARARAAALAAQLRLDPEDLAEADARAELGWKGEAELPAAPPIAPRRNGERSSSKKAKMSVAKAYISFIFLMLAAFLAACFAPFRADRRIPPDTEPGPTPPSSS